MNVGILCVFLAHALLCLEALASGSIKLNSAISGRCLDVEFKSQNSGAKILLWDCNETDSQIFEVQPEPNRQYVFRNARTRKCLDLPFRSLKAGVGLVSSSCTGDLNQSFFMERLPNDNKIQLRLAHSRHCLDLELGTALNGEKIVQQPCDIKKTSQHFVIQDRTAHIDSSEAPSVFGYENGFNTFGFDIDGIHKDTGSPYDLEGFKESGLNRHGLPRFDPKKRAPYGKSFRERELKAQEFVDRLDLSIARRPNIFLLILDTIRDDYVDAGYVPQMLALKEHSIYTKLRISGATSTLTATFALFQGLAAYKYYAAGAAETELGALPLYIFKHKLGYKIHAVSNENYICLSKRHHYTENIYQAPSIVSNAQLNWGLQSYLFDECVESGIIPSAFYSERFNTDAQKFEQMLRVVANASDEGNLFILHTLGGHTPQLWEAQDEYPKKPGQQASEWAYRNGLRYHDRLLSNFIRTLQQINRFDSSIIVTVSDHGEIFPTNIPYSNHGNYPISKELSHVPLYFKFPKDDPSLHRFADAQLTRVSTHADVFPTLFEYFGIFDTLAPWFDGRPINDLKNHVVSTTRVSSNELAFYGYPYKLVVRLKNTGGSNFQPQSLKLIENLSEDDIDFLHLQDFDDHELELPNEELDATEYIGHPVFVKFMNRLIREKSR